MTSSKPTNSMPVPRIQLRWSAKPEPSEQFGSAWLCHYELVMPLRKHDVRAERQDKDGDPLPDHTEFVIPLKSPTLRGETGRMPCYFQDSSTLYYDDPYRDGTHARWDAEALGNLPIFVIAPCGTVIPEPAKNRELRPASAPGRPVVDIDLYSLELLEKRASVATSCANGDFWYWQGRDDFPESLTCPVLMSADTLRGLLDRVRCADGMVVVPRRLTAANGAKAALMGEFTVTVEQECQECEGSGFDADEVECKACDGIGLLNDEVPVDWTTIKAIHKSMVHHFDHNPPEPDPRAALTIHDLPFDEQARIARAHTRNALLSPTVSLAWVNKHAQADGVELVPAPLPDAVEKLNALRYGFLRDQPVGFPYGTPRIAVPVSDNRGDFLSGEDADAAVDAAMLAAGQPKECETCEGVGSFDERLTTSVPTADPARPCPDCRGTGEASA